MEPRPPAVTDDPSIARQAVRVDGVAVLTGRGTTADDVVDAAHAVFGHELREVPPPAEVREGGVGDRRRAGVDNTVALSAHTDGFAYGDQFPDHFLLGCARAADTGGESFVVDGYEVIERLRSTGLVQRLLDTPVDQTEPDMRRSVTAIIGVTNRGRTMLRRFPFQRAAAESVDPAADDEMIAAWWSAVDEAAAGAPRFRLAPGDVLIVDNYRMLHGREPYADLDRQLWRLWVWTTAAHGVPDGLLHSDSRHAAVTP